MQDYLSSWYADDKVEYETVWQESTWMNDVVGWYLFEYPQREAIRVNFYFFYSWSSLSFQEVTFMYAPLFN